MRTSAIMGAAAMIVVVAGTMWNSGESFSQTHPTATEEFNLRIRCKQLADEKAESMAWHPLAPADAPLGMSPATVESLNRQHEATHEMVLSSHSSNYDAKNNRCYIKIFVHEKIGWHKETEVEHRQIYDGQTDDLLAFAKIENGEKVGLVFDRGHRKTTDTNLGWDDANAYMDEMMLDKRR